MSTIAAALEALLFPGGLPSWEAPELTGLNRLPPRATLDRPARRSLAGDWDFRLAPRPEDAIALRGRGRRVEVPDLPSLDTAGRDGLALLLVDVLERLDRLFDAETPYMLWIHQRPFDGRAWPGARLHVEIVTPWRAPGVPRFVAAGELGSGVYFNPVAPDAAAQALRDSVAPAR